MPIKLTRPIPPGHSFGCQCPDKKQAVAPVDTAQETIKKIADEVVALNEMALFKGWVEARQATALRRMTETTGEDFSRYCGDFSLFTDAVQVMSMFERELRG